MTTKKKEHELVQFRECTFGDGGHFYHEGFDRAVCSCGWESAPSKKHEALVALFKIHKDCEREDAQRHDDCDCIAVGRPHCLVHGKKG